MTPHSDPVWPKYVLVAWSIFLVFFYQYLPDKVFF